jgi:integrase/recombinase XerD
MTKLPMPPNPPPNRSRFSPHIYTREEIRKLLRSLSGSEKPNDKIHPKTVRAALLTLYATGATVGEVTRLVSSDVDLKLGRVEFSGSLLKASRCIPIGTNLARVMRQYVAWQRRIGAHSEFFFSRMDGKNITARALRIYFERIRRRTGIAGYRDGGQRPCLRDLRPTFAVHQITSWIKSKEDVNRMLPALGAYIGNVGLESTERYLRLTPERFQSALNKLGPRKYRARWRDDPALLEILANY